MLTAIQNGGAKMEPIEAGTHPAVCYGVVDIGEQYNEKYGKAVRKCIVLFEVIGQTFVDKDGIDRNRSISNTYTLSLSEKSALYRDLIAWRGRPFTPEELKGFNLENIIGVPCLLSITHTERDGNTYANISGIMKMPKGMETKGMEAHLSFDLDRDPLSDMAKLPEWIQKRIQDSVTYKDLISAGTGAPKLEEIDDSDGELPF